MRHSVCVVTGSRAEFGLLKPLIEKLQAGQNIGLRLAVTGSHLSTAFGNTQREIESAGFAIHAKIPVLQQGDSKADMARATAAAISAFADYFENNRPELLIVLGDRFEIFGASVAAAMLGVPIAHLHGGETTEGAVDEFIRHSITKMSTLHFVSCEEYRRRVIQLGESPNTVFNVGATGVENILKLEKISKAELEHSLDFALGEKYSIVTFHPVTKEENSATEQLYELMSAIDCFNDMKYLITKANADAGGNEINKIWKNEAAKHTNWCVVASLGSQRYLSALSGALMMIGNSSSGIIEAPAMHIPTVNIGDRQKGRMMAESVICCEPHKDAIVSAMQKAMSPEFKQIAKDVVSPFGDGTASDKIVAEIEKFLSSGDKNLKKKFYDVEFEVTE